MLTEGIIVGCITPIFLAIFAVVQQNWRKKDREDAAMYRQHREEVEKEMLKKEEDRDHKIDLLCDANRSLLRADIIQMHDRCIKQDYATLEDVEYMEKVYAAYHGLNGNGSGTKLYNEFMELPIRS